MGMIPGAVLKFKIFGFFYVVFFENNIIDNCQICECYLFPLFGSHF